MDAELIYTVPALYDPALYSGHEPVVRIGVSAGGGGTIGKSYPHTTFTLTVEADGEIIADGETASSRYTPLSHMGAVALLLSAYGVYGDAELTARRFTRLNGTSRTEAILGPRSEPYATGLLAELISQESERFSLSGGDIEIAAGVDTDRDLEPEHLAEGIRQVMAGIEIPNREEWDGDAADALAAVNEWADQEALASELREYM